MTEHQKRLFAASRLISRIADMGKTEKFDGHDLRDLAWACTTAANDDVVVGISDEILRVEKDMHSVKVPSLHVIPGGAA